MRQSIVSCRQPHKQRGMALMMMLIIVMLGAAAVLASSLRSAALQIDRDKTTADALAQAKEALIGYAARDTNHPGSLPCPDVDDDGLLKMNVDYIGSRCASTIGRLPWKTLGLPELRDGAGEHLWYTVSKPFAAIGSPNINSDTQGTLNISGTTTASSAIAIIFAPGNVLPSQSRSAAATAPCAATGTTIPQSQCATNYLEGSNAALSTWAAPNVNYQSAASGSAFNDQTIFITHEQLFHPVQMRIAREAKACLDAYAAANANTYPWAAPVTDTSNYAGVSNTFFGRLPMTSSPSLSCALIASSTYWNDWKNLVFYQIAAGNQPGGSGCTSSTCLSINGKGSYRAAVIVAGQIIASDISPRSPIDVATYLEGQNRKTSSTTPSTTFETYRLPEAAYSTVNDLVQCVDGLNDCK